MCTCCIGLLIFLLVAMEAPKLLENISKCTDQQAHILLRLAVWALEDFKAPRPDFGSDATVDKLMIDKYAFLKSPLDMGVFLKYTLKYLLYQPEELVAKPRALVETEQVCLQRMLSFECLEKSA